LNAGLNTFQYVEQNSLSFKDPSGLVNKIALARASVGLISNSLGVIVGFGVGAIPEPTLLTKAAAVVVIGKSSSGVVLNARNFYSALIGCDDEVASSLPNLIAETFYPGNESARRISDVVDLSIDLALGFGIRTSLKNSIGLRVGPPPAGNMIEIVKVKDPSDIGTLGNIFISTSVIDVFVKDVRPK
jgi:hypothetical protein